LGASENTEPNSGSSARKDESLAEHGPQSDAQDTTKDDIVVGNIRKAVGDAAPRPLANSGASDRKTYESRVEELDAVYSRVVPESGRPPKPKANKGAPIDDYDNQVAEYVFSSLAVALPHPHYSRRGTGIAFQAPVDNKLKNNIVDPNADFGSTGSPADTAAPAPDKGTSEPEMEAIVVNYRAWDPGFYSKLCLDRFSIRLVEILPGSPGDDVSVRMDVHPLNKVAMQYEALSYVWGNPEPAKYISVNEVKVPINPNLYDALISLRQPNSERRIWIDAICLNQMSFAEKSKEVQKMGQIYSLAKTVNVFLGAPSLSNSTFINSFLTFLNRDDKGEAAIRYAEEGLRGLDRICEKCQINVPDICKGFMEACLQPWWGRIWTLVSSAFLLSRVALCLLYGVLTGYIWSKCQF
jgi:hypothetical protein